MFTHLDEQLESATRDYVRSRSLSAGDIASGFSELARLRTQQEPDYSHAGLPVAYAFRYLPKRVACIVAALTRLPDPGCPRRVLDIGSGSGATSIAMGLLGPDLPIEIDAVEPSPSMRAFAQCFPLDSHISLSQSSGTLEKIVAGDITLGPEGYDLIMMSACLPYDSRVARCPAAWQRWAASSSAALIAIEPQAKAAQLGQLGKSLRHLRHGAVAEYCCHDLPAVLQCPLTLPRTTKLLRGYHARIAVSDRLTGPGLSMLGRPPHAVDTWNEHGARKERVLVCGHPSSDWRSGARNWPAQGRSPRRRKDSGWVASVVDWLREHW
jgi:SAM-dependent methyltransferase